MPQRHDKGHQKRRARELRAQAEAERLEPFALALELVKAGKAPAAILGHNTRTRPH